jgi:Flp pilus assembly protein TadG
MTNFRKSKECKRGTTPNIKGQSLVEFAMLIPLLLLFVFGTFDLGRLFYYKIVFTNAAREGAHYLFAHPNDKSSGFSGTIAAVMDEADKSEEDIIVAEDIAIVCIDDVIPFNSCDRGSTANVSVSQDIHLGLIGLFIQTPTITGTASMLIP